MATTFILPIRNSPSVSLFPACRFPPALHSFPTRRSSDLVGVNISCVISRESTLFDFPCLESAISIANFAKSLGVRSEEHTSELQSLTNLVCRLLLENKNLRAEDNVLQIFDDLEITETLE